MGIAQCMQTGVVSELKVMSQYVDRGYSVFTPFAVGERSDFIAEKNGRFVRVQVKTGSTFNDGRELMACSQRPYTKEEVDVLVIFDPYAETYYYIPVEHVENMTNIRLRLVSYLYNVKNNKALSGESYKTFLG